MAPAGRIHRVDAVPTDQIVIAVAADKSIIAGAAVEDVVQIVASQRIVARAPRNVAQVHDRVEAGSDAGIEINGNHCR